MLLKPGGYLLSFGGTRTWHRMAVAIEDAGAEIRDTICWLYGSGFPKSHNQEGAWEGWGSALKPAFEPIIVAQRPFDRSIAENLGRHGVGAINIDGCRVEGEPVKTFDARVPGDRPRDQYRTGTSAGPGKMVDRGRWPANVIHDGSDEVLEAFAAHGADKGAIAPVTRRGADKFRNTFGAFKGEEEAGATFRGDSGTAARFFYCAKASKAERGESKHPTIKPLTLIRYLVRLVTPKGGTVLDPFAGSGTTGHAALEEGMSAVLIEREAQFVEDIKKRLEARAA